MYVCHIYIHFRKSIYHTVFSLAIFSLSVFFFCIAIFFLVPSTRRKNTRENIIVCGIETQKDYDLACEIEEKAIVMKTQ